MSVLTRPAQSSRPTAPRRLPRLAFWTAVTAIVVPLLALGALAAVRYEHDDSRRNFLGSDGWPWHGQAAFSVGTGRMRVSPDEQPAPIASLAKVMTALLVLRAAPLTPGYDGFHLTVDGDDVTDTEQRGQQDQSIVTVRAGEVLTERQALVALLLPSANNMAIMLSRRVAGTEFAFVQRMNATARAMGMPDTTYTDPSGFEPDTSSTAADQLVLARIAMRNSAFAHIVGLASYPIPVAGIVENTDTLLGSGGFVGIKTGSDDAAGGCFMFRTRQVVRGAALVVTGVVLGQQGHSLVAAGLYAARQFDERIIASAP